MQCSDSPFLSGSPKDATSDPKTKYDLFAAGEYCFQEVVNMVKGISRQVIVVHSPEPKLFEQAIFILNDEAVKKGIAEDTLLKEAKKLMAVPEKNRYFWRGTLCALSGAILTGVAWLLTVLL